MHDRSVATHFGAKLKGACGCSCEVSAGHVQAKEVRISEGVILVNIESPNAVDRVAHGVEDVLHIGVDALQYLHMYACVCTRTLQHRSAFQW